jgi:hypothetical protein
MTDIANINILSEAKKEYTNQLQKILKPRLYEGFKSIYEDIIKISANELLQNNGKQTSVVKNFQKVLKEIPQWNQEMIKKEYGRILKLSSCDYIDKLIEAVFVTNTKILTSVQINNNHSMQIKINIPQPCHFIHKCYIKSASEIYKNPYLFDVSKNLTPKEKHNNLREALALIDLSINNAVSDLLPIGEILKQSLMMQETNQEPLDEKKNRRDKDISEEQSELESEYQSEEVSEYETEDSSVEEKSENNDSKQEDKKEVELDVELDVEKDNNIVLNDDTIKNNEIILNETYSKNNLINLNDDDYNNNNNNDIKKQFQINSNEIVEDDVKKIIILTNNNNIELNNENEQIKKIIYDDRTINTVKKTNKKSNKIDINQQVHKIIDREGSSFTNIKTLYDKKDKTKTELLKKLDEIRIENKKKLEDEYYTRSSYHNSEELTENKEEEIFTPKKKETPVIIIPAIEKITVQKEDVKKDVTVYKKTSDSQKITSKPGRTNPFIKNIKNNKFHKIKFYGGSEKNSSFYKKKYEQNSANYNLLSNKEDLQTTLNIRKSVLTPSKNKIIMEENSSDEMENNEIDI